MEDTSRRLRRVIRVKKVLPGHHRNFLPDNEQPIQSVPTNAIRIIPKRTDPITLKENSLPVCYDRIIIDFLNSFYFYFISLHRFEEFLDIKLNHINRILLELHLHFHKTAHKLLVQLYQFILINHHYK